MSKSESTSTQPKSIRQKRILDIAADNPGATLAEIAEQIPSVSTDHVDRVLDQYGDPAASDDSDAEDPPAEDPPAGPSDTASNDTPSLDSQDSPGDQPTTTSTDQPNEPTSTVTGEEPDDTTETEAPANTPAMDRDTEAEPTESTESTEPVESVEGQSSNVSLEAANLDADGAPATDETPPDPGDLTQKERETLRAISYEPTATQDEIADMLSISRATVSNRVNAIPGFDWADRGSFVEAVFDEHVTVDASASPNKADGSAPTRNTGKEAVTDGASNVLSDQSGDDTLPQETPSSTPDGVVDGPAPTGSASQAADQEATTDGSETASGEDLEEISHQLEDVAQRLATMEQELQDTRETDEASPLSDTDLLHKVVYACMNSDRITEEEELQILDTLMN